MIRGHEQRAINYLVNEYLLLHGYRLTAITFSDENTSAAANDLDLDDWDAIGLNVAKPPSVLRLYRDYSNKRKKKKISQRPKELSEVSSQTERYVPQQVIDLTSELNVILRDSEEIRSSLNASQAEVRDKEEEISGLRCQIQNLEDLRYKGGGSRADGVGSSSTGPSGIQNSPSLDEVKQRVGKLFQRKS